MSDRLSFRLGLIVLVVLLLGVALTTGGRERGQFMFVEELAPGMTGYCKTALGGNQIVTFNFTIVDILRYVGVFRTTQEYKVTILARAEEGFWIAGGMSGSPCYVNDKLIGALFAGWLWSTAHTEPGEPFLIQPIEEMLPVLDACLRKAGTSVGMVPAWPADLLGYLPPSDRAIAAASLTGATEIERIKVVSSPPPREEVEAHPETLFVRYLSAPVTVTGLSPRAFNWLKEGARVALKGSALRYLRGEEKFNAFIEHLSRGLEDRYDVELHYSYSMGGGRLQAEPGPLEPGAPIGSAVMLGDISWGSYGTVTYMEDNCLLAYGHPDWFLGETELFMTSAYITDVIRSLQRPFKEGFLVEEVGSILEDRLTAIAGAVGKPARAVQFNIKVTDKDSGVTNEFNSKSVALPDPYLGYPDNLLFAGLGAVDVTLDRIGPGTMDMHLTVKGPGGEVLLERSDIYVSDTDIAIEGTFDPGWIAYLLAWNEFEEPRISEIDLELSVERALRMKVIESVEPLQEEVKAGQRLHYTVILQPYRGTGEALKGSIEIPEWLGGEIICLTAMPASWAFWKFEVSRYGEGPWARPSFFPSNIFDLEGLIEAIEDAPTNNLLIVMAETRFGVVGIDVKSVGDFFVDGYRSSEKCVRVY